MSFNIEEFIGKVTKMYSKGIEPFDKSIQRYFNEIEKTKGEYLISDKKIKDPKAKRGSIVEEIGL